MKKLPVLILALMLTSLLQAQTKIGVNLLVAKNQLVTKNDRSSAIIGRIPLRKVNGRDFLACVAKINPSFGSSTFQFSGGFSGMHTANVATLYLPIDSLHFWNTLPGVDFIDLAARIYPTLDKATHDTKVDSVHMGWNLATPYTGKDVIIGILDWGFDYTNPMFYDTTLTHTRILKAWDQFRNAGPSPAGMSYGTEINGETALLNAQCDTFNIYQYAYHGSHVAGICGGSGAGTIYRGVAFEANYLMATFLVDAAAVLDAYQWMKDNAEAESKRLVINQSWGLYYMGNLDGTSLLSRAIDDFSADGVVFVSSAGNNGDTYFHISKTWNGTDSLKTIVGFDSYAYYPNMFGQCLTMWGSENSPFKAKLQFFNAQYALQAETPFFETAHNMAFVEDTVIIDSDSIFYNVIIDSLNYLNNKPFIQLRVKNKSSAIKVGLCMFGESGSAHAWNVIELTNGVGNWGSNFSAPTTGFTAGDKNYGVGEPACATSAIAVASYLSQTATSGGALSSFSSIGPSTGGIMKPDIAAPGQNVCSSVSSFSSTTFNSLNTVTSVTFNGRTYKFVRLSGTSMSSPLVTGIVALLLQAKPDITPAEVMQVLKETAREDSKTGDLPETGDPKWGWGKVNALAAIYEVLGITGYEDLSKQPGIKAYPNPASDVLYIDCPEMPREIQIFNSVGGMVQTYKYPIGNMIDVSGLSTGIYLVHLQFEDRSAAIPVKIER